MASLLNPYPSINLSYYTIPAAFGACLVPHVLAVASLREAYDHAYPRSSTQAVDKCEGIEKEAKQRIARAKAASENGFETIGLYAAAVVAANQAGVDIPVINKLTLGYTISRFAYVFAYVQLGADRRLAFIRSVIWLIGICTLLSLFTKAGDKVSA